MKLRLFTGALILTLSVPAFAWNDFDDDSRDGYTSSFGNRYEYDLSNPSDRISYDVDVSAQMRDRLDVNPTRDLERGMGQYGGGVYDD